MLQLFLTLDTTCNGSNLNKKDIFFYLYRDGIQLSCHFDHRQCHHLSLCKNYTQYTPLRADHSRKYSSYNFCRNDETTRSINETICNTDNDKNDMFRTVIHSRKFSSRKIHRTRNNFVKIKKNISYYIAMWEFHHNRYYKDWAARLACRVTVTSA